jgi:hypothetical protein
LFARVPKDTPIIRLQLPPTSTQVFTIRAAALAGNGMFPTVTAIGTYTISAGHAVAAKITMGSIRPSVQKIAETGASTTLEITFESTDFFRSGDVVELWISDWTAVRNCTGLHYLSPLIKNDSFWRADFVVPTNLVGPSTAIQFAFHAIDLKVAARIPLLVWPDRERNEPSLQIVSQENSQAPGEPRHSNRPPQESSPVFDPYVVKSGPNGRLIRVPPPAEQSDHPKGTASTGKVK